MQSESETMNGSLGTTACVRLIPGRKTVDNAMFEIRLSSTSTRKDSESGNWHGLSLVYLRMAEVLSCRPFFHPQGS